MVSKECTDQDVLFVLMGRDAARQGSAPHSAERCRAAPSPIQNKTIFTGRAQDTVGLCRKDEDEDEECAT